MNTKRRQSTDKGQIYWLYYPWLNSALLLDLEGIKTVPWTQISEGIEKHTHTHSPFSIFPILVTNISILSVYIVIKLHMVQSNTEKILLDPTRKKTYLQSIPKYRLITTLQYILNQPKTPTRQETE